MSSEIKSLAYQTDCALSEIHAQLWITRQSLSNAQKRRASRLYATDERRLAAVDAAIAQIIALIAELTSKVDELNAVWEANGRWSRAFVVQGGHVHSTMACHTCFPTTRFWWNVDYSAATEAEIVEAAGDRACTVCYPSAPVDRPSTMFTPEERATEADRIARAQAKAERAAKTASKAPTAEGEPLMVPSDNGRYMQAIKTEVSARQEWNRAEDWKNWGSNEDRRAYYADRQERIEVALAGKYGITAVEMRDQLKAKYTKRRSA